MTTIATVGLGVVAVAATVAAGAQAASGAEREQSAWPPIDFNESVEQARTLREGGGSWFDRFLPGEQFELFNNCERITVWSPNLRLFTDAGIEADVAAMEWTAEQIRRMAETRFRNASVLEEAEGRERGRFRIRIAGSPDDFDSRASFHKVVIDLATGEVAFAETYVLMGLGGRGRVDATPVAKASTLIDQFLTSYLAANADACARRGGQQ